MQERLGNVIFWIGIIIAVGWLVLSYFGYASEPRQAPLDGADIFAITIVPVLSVGIGWALRYILGGGR
jgi:hypothetical protein